MHRLYLVLIFVLLALSVSFAQTGPGWVNTRLAPVVTEPPVPVLSLKTQAVSSSGSTNGIADLVTVDIEELARSLQHNPELIYRYVHNHMRYAPYYGSLKGATRTLLDRCGNDLDQAALTVALLRASGFPARYVYGTLRLPISNADEYDAGHLLGTDSDWYQMGTIFYNGGMELYELNASYITIPRFWVRATINGTTVDMDPSYKRSEKTEGIDLLSAMGYSRSNLLASAGGTVNTNEDSIVNIDENGLRQKLSGYTTKLLSTLRRDYTNESVDEITGVWSIVLEAESPGINLTRFIYSEVEEWEQIPTNLFHTVNIAQGSLNCQFYIPEIADQKISIGYEGKNQYKAPSYSWDLDMGCISDVEYRDFQVTYDEPNVWKYSFTDIAYDDYDNFSFASPTEGRLPFTMTFRFDGRGKPTGEMSAHISYRAYRDQGSYYPYGMTISGRIVDPVRGKILLNDRVVIETDMTSVDVAQKLAISVNHPYPHENGIYCDQAHEYNVHPDEDNSYVVLCGFGDSDDGKFLETRQRHLEELLEWNYGKDSLELRSESLNILGQTWLRETALANRLLNRMTDTYQITHHRFGLMAQESGSYVDVANQVVSLAESVSSSTWRSSFYGGSLMASALEHGVLEQQQGTNRPSISTIKLLTLASRRGDRVFRTDTNNYQSVVRSELQNYSTPELDFFSDFVARGGSLVLPEDKHMTPDEWDWQGSAVTPDFRTTGLSGICVRNMVRKDGCRWDEKEERLRINSRHRWRWKQLKA